VLERDAELYFGYGLANAANDNLARPLKGSIVVDGSVLMLQLWGT